jgi:hypothetical protein
MFSCYATWSLKQECLCSLQLVGSQDLGCQDQHGRARARVRREREREKGGGGGGGRQGEGGREEGRETERSLHVSESIFSYVQGGVRHTLSYIVIHCHTLSYIVIHTWQLKTVQSLRVTNECAVPPQPQALFIHPSVTPSVSSHFMSCA